MNNKWARRAGQTSALAAGALLVAGAGVAHAGEIETEDNYGALNGNQLVAPIQAPINVCGNSVAVLGIANAACEGGSEAENHGFGAEMESEDNYGLLNGNQAYVPIQAPIDVSGNAIAVGGLANAFSEGGASAHLEESANLEEGYRHHGHGGWEMETEDNYGALNGNQAYVPIQVPINACGNAIAVLGIANAFCEGGASAKIEESHGESWEMETEDNYGLLNGNQLHAPIQVPINICGNAIAVLGIANAACEGGASAEIGGDHHHKHDWGKKGKGKHYAADTLVDDAQLASVAGQQPTEEFLPVVGDLTSDLFGFDVEDVQPGFAPYDVQDFIPSDSQVNPADAVDAGDVVDVDAVDADAVADVEEENLPLVGNLLGS